MTCVRRRYTLRAPDEKGRVCDDAGSLSRAIRCGRWRLALHSSIVRRFILVRCRFESAGQLAGRRRRHRSEHQHLCIGTPGGRVRWKLINDGIESLLLLMRRIFKQRRPREKNIKTRISFFFLRFPKHCFHRASFRSACCR